MATHYLHKFDTTAEFLALSPDTSKGQGFGAVGDVLYVNISGTAFPLADASGTGSFAKAKSDSSLTPAAAFSLIRGDIAFSGATIAVASASHEAGVRGSVTVNAGSTFTEGFLYGVQGRAILNGTMDEGAAARLTGVLGKLDLDTGTWVDGQGSAVWADVTFGAATLTGHAEINALRVTNSGGANINALAYFNGKADVLLDISEPAASFIAAAGTGAQSAGVSTGGVAAQVLKVTVGGVTRYIPLFSSNA